MRLLLPLIFIAALGGGAYVYVQQQTPVGAGLKRVEATTQAARSFDDKVKTVQAAVDEARRTGKSTAVEVTFSEQELTSKVAEATAGIIPSGLAATDTQVHLTGGNVVATSKVNVQGFDVNVGVVATPVVQNGRTTFVVKEVQTGGIPLPDAVKQQIQSQVGQAVDPRTLGLPLDVSKVQIVDGKVVISGTARP